MSKLEKPQWDVIGAKQIIDDYKKPSEFIDIGAIYYAATQLEGAYDAVVKERDEATRRYQEYEHECQTIKEAHAERDALSAQVRFQLDANSILAAQLAESRQMYNEAWKASGLRIERLAKALAYAKDGIDNLDKHCETMKTTTDDGEEEWWATTIGLEHGKEELLAEIERLEQSDE